MDGAECPICEPIDWRDLEDRTLEDLASVGRVVVRLRNRAAVDSPADRASQPLG